MKALRKLFVFAPIMVLSLSACEAQLSEDKAKERINKYNASEVAKEYKTFDVNYKLTVNKKTGVFGEGGALETVTKSFETAFDMAEETYKGQPATNGIFKVSSTSDALVAIDQLGFKMDAKFAYYPYKTDGLKIMTTASADVNENGMLMKLSSKGNTYVLDDGRLEKDESNIKMNVSGEMLGLKVSGDLDISILTTYTWNK